MRTRGFPYRTEQVAPHERVTRGQLYPESWTEVEGLSPIAVSALVEAGIHPADWLYFWLCPSFSWDGEACGCNSADGCCEDDFGDKPCRCLIHRINEFHSERSKAEYDWPSKKVSVSRY